MQFFQHLQFAAGEDIFQFCCIFHRGLHSTLFAKTKNMFRERVRGPHGRLAVFSENKDFFYTLRSS